MTDTNHLRVQKTKELLFVGVQHLTEKFMLNISQVKTKVMCPRLHSESVLQLGLDLPSPNIKAVVKTYIFKPILAELYHEMEKHQPREPKAPHDNFFHSLNIEHAKNKYKLVEDEIPEFVLEMLKKEDMHLFSVVNIKTTLN